MTERKPAMTGGCQCGAVRFATYRAPARGDICHCRMCQKAFGNLFGAFASVHLEDMAWTRGEPAIFKSSEVVERGFCRDCGTPLSFRYVDTDRIALSLGSFDTPPRSRSRNSTESKAACPPSRRSTDCRALRRTRARRRSG